jgi:hypothetical protein
MQQPYTEFSFHTCKPEHFPEHSDMYNVRLSTSFERAVSHLFIRRKSVSSFQALDLDTKSVSRIVRKDINSCDQGTKSSGHNRHEIDDESWSDFVLGVVLIVQLRFQPASITAVSPLVRDVRWTYPAQTADKPDTLYYPHQ